uniref:Uncharacterized protein n=1 Tax=mine drainage metagenome TaxID=410659 RepID=E6QUU4_9ZZZZ
MSHFWMIRLNSPSSMMDLVFERLAQGGCRGRKNGRHDSIFSQSIVGVHLFAFRIVEYTF